MKRRARAADELLAGRAISDGRSGSSPRGGRTTLRRPPHRRRAGTRTAAECRARRSARWRARPVARLPIRATTSRPSRRMSTNARRRSPRCARWLRPAIVPSAVAAILLGGLAGAGALPAPVATRDSRTSSSHLGVSIPGDSHHSRPAHPSTQSRRRRVGPGFGPRTDRVQPFRDQITVDGHAHAIVDEHASSHDGHEHAAVHACVARHARNRPADHRARNGHHSAATGIAAHGDDTERAGVAQAADHHGPDDPAPAAALAPRL